MMKAWFCVSILVAMINAYFHVTILWNEVTIWWNEVTKGWNEVAWNEVVMERSDRIPSRLLPISFSPCPGAFVRLLFPSYRSVRLEKETTG